MKPPLGRDSSVKLSHVRVEQDAKRMFQAKVREVLRGTPLGGASRLPGVVFHLAYKGTLHV